MNTLDARDEKQRLYRSVGLERSARMRGLKNSTGILRMPLKNERFAIRGLR